MAEPDVVVEHPNRDKAASRAARAVVIGLLLASAVLLGVITVGAWDALVGAKPLQIAYLLLYLGLAALVARWRRGVLPVGAALAVVLLIFAVVSVPGWLARDKDGFADPALAADVVGLLTAVLALLQVALIGAALRGFQQAWHVEVERPVEDRRPGAPAPV
jgi:peptidoglycan/LPS O-acetylase OafA/YrhL